MTRYEGLLKHLFSLQSKVGKNRNLTAIQKVATLLGNPHQQFPTIHIAGTNGKGSVAFKIAEALRLGGYRVGLYSSPHLFSYRERIKVNEDMISKQATVIGLEKVFALAPKLHFFEISTLLAFDYFANQKVDIAIIETGIGGRLDATNIILPILSVITNVEYDHQDILGTTRTAIGTEKGGVIKKRVPILLGPRADLPILRKISDTKNAPLYLAGVDSREMAKRALEIIQPLFPLDPRSKREGLSKCLPFRLDVRNDVLLDVAHNPSGFQYLFDHIKKRFSPKPLYLLLALAQDKDVSKIVKLFNHVDEIALFSSTHPRLRHPSEIADALEKRSYYRWKIFETASDALRCFNEKSSPKRIVVAGSFYMMEEVMRYFS